MSTSDRRSSWGSAPAASATSASVRPSAGGPAALGSPGAHLGRFRSLRTLLNRPSGEGARPCRSEPLRDKTIVVTGVTGQVAEPVAVALAKDNRVIGGARFKDEAARRRLEDAGVTCVPIDLLVRGRGRSARRRRLRDQFRRVQDQRLGPRSAGQQRRLGLVDGASPERGGVRPLLHHRRVQAARPPRLQGGGRARGQPRGVAVPAHVQHLQDRRRGHGPVGGGSATTSPPRWPGCPCPTETGGDGRPSTSR